MDPKRARQLIDEFCAELKERKKRSLKALKPLGVGVAMGLAAMSMGCDDDSEDPPPSDLYGVIMDVQDDNPDVAAELYGAPVDIEDDETQSVDVYGVPMDVEEDNEEVATELYGIIMDVEEDEGPSDLYGVIMDVEEDEGPVDLYGMVTDVQGDA